MKTINYYATKATILLNNLGADSASIILFGILQLISK